MNHARIITVFQPLAGVTQQVIEAFAGDAGRLLPDSRACGRHEWRMPLHGAGLTREVRVHVGDVWQWSEGHWRSITWEPIVGDQDGLPIERLLPTFVGEIGLQIDRETLILTGAYNPPLGVLGAIVDSAALGVVARSTGQHLLGAMARQLTEGALA